MILLGKTILKARFSTLSSFLVGISISVKRHHDHNNSYKGEHLIRVAYSFRGLVHYYHGRWQAGGHGA